MYTDSLDVIFDPVRLEDNIGQTNTFYTSDSTHVVLQYSHPSTPLLYQPHSHPEYNIVICLAGAISKSQMGTTQVIEPGEALICNSGVEHTSSYLPGSKGCKAVSLVCDRRVMAGLLASCSMPVLQRGLGPVFEGKISSPALYSCALDAVQELNHCQIGHRIVLDGLIMRMLVETLRSWPRSRVEQHELDMTPRLPRRDFVRAYEFMRWCRKDAFRLEQLCHFLGTSQERFIRLFHAATNASPANFYNRMLLEKGRDLLEKDHSLSVKEISYLLGYRTTSHFVASFHRVFGISPVKFRSGFRNGHPLDVGVRPR